MTQLTRPSYEVWITPVELGTDPDHVIEVTTGDQMRGELEAAKMGLPKLQDAPLNATAVWIWCAMARLGLTELRCPQFLATELGEWRPVDDEHGEALLTPVDPTKADPSASASP